MDSDSEKPNTEKTSKAAAATLAVALALKAERETLHNFPLPEQVTVSAWQAVLRSNIHGRRGNLR
jgi:hypothetical protein